MAAEVQAPITETVLRLDDEQLTSQPIVPACYACGEIRSFSKRSKLTACSNANCASYSNLLQPTVCHLPACGGLQGWREGQPWFCSARCFLDDLDNNGDQTSRPSQPDIPQGHIYMATLNCHGLLANRYAIWRALAIEKFDVLMLNVTEQADIKSKKYMPSGVDPDFYLHYPQYDLIWGDAQRKDHGVAMYVRGGAVIGTRIESVRLPHKGLFGMDTGETDIAGNFLGVKTTSHPPWNGATIVSVFRPPKDNVKFQHAFVERLSDYLGQNAVRTVVAGDMNFNCPLWRLKACAQQIVHGPTRQLANSSPYEGETMVNPAQLPVPRGIKWKMGSLRRTHAYTAADVDRAPKNTSSINSLMKLIRRPYKKGGLFNRGKHTQSTYNVSSSSMIHETQNGTLEQADRTSQLAVDLTSDNETSVSPPVSPRSTTDEIGPVSNGVKNVGPSEGQVDQSKQWVGNHDGAVLDLVLVTDKVNWVKCGLGMALDDKHSKTRSRLVWAQLQILPA